MKNLLQALYISIVFILLPTLGKAQTNLQNDKKMTEQVLKDKNGHIIGKVVKRGNYYELQDKNGHTLGKYDPVNDRTIDKNGHTIGRGNLLTTLLP